MKFQSAFSGLSVDDQDRARQFYTETLGLKLIDETMGLRLQLPGGSGEVFIYPKDDHQPATFTVLNFVVADIDAAVKALKAKQVEFEHYEGMTDESSVARSDKAHGGPDIAWFRDPAGNILSLIHEA